MGLRDSKFAFLPYEEAVKRGEILQGPKIPGRHITFDSVKKDCATTKNLTMLCRAMKQFHFASFAFDCV